MKKLLLLAGVAMMLASCSGNSAEQAGTLTAATDSVNQTLNGYDEADALNMMKHFIANKDKDPNPVDASFWISKEMLHDIVTLLNEEEKQQLAARPPNVKDSVGVVDGLRIYFASDTTVSTYPLNNTIVLVSTKDNGPAPAGMLNAASKRLHKDYYRHIAGAHLFSLRNYDVQTIGGDGSRGDSLYLSTPGAARKPECGITHGIARYMGETMVRGFSTTAPHTINTHGEWFDIEFLRYLDKSKRLNGIRIYYARHPISADKSTSDRDAFIISTTERDPKTGITRDYFSCNEKLIDEYREAYKKRFPPGDPLDNGELCPDNCN